jgi:hypothetical protein
VALAHRTCEGRNLWLGDGGHASVNKPSRTP